MRVLPGARGPRHLLPGAARLQPGVRGGRGETRRGPGGLGGPPRWAGAEAGLVPGACGAGRRRRAACAHPLSAPGLAAPLCDSRRSLPLSGPLRSRAGGQRLREVARVSLPPRPAPPSRRVPASVSPAARGCSFKPGFGGRRWRVAPPLAARAPGNPPGARKGQLRLAEAARDVRASPTPPPPPPEARGGGRGRGGAGVRADSGCPPAPSPRRQLGSADAILLGQIFPSSQIPLQPPQNGSCSGGRCAG